MWAVSLDQPHASLVRYGLKKNETRTFFRGYRGPLIICSTRNTRRVDSYLMRPAFQEALTGLIKRPAGQNEVRFSDLTYGCALCSVEMYGVISAEDAIIKGVSDAELAFGDYSPGRLVWLFKNLQPLAEPVPVRGLQGLYLIKDPHTQTKIIQQIAKWRELQAAQPTV